MSDFLHRDVFFLSDNEHVYFSSFRGFAEGVTKQVILSYASITRKLGLLWTLYEIIAISVHHAALLVLGHALAICGCRVGHDLAS